MSIVLTDYELEYTARRILGHFYGNDYDESGLEFVIGELKELAGIEDNEEEK